MGREGPEYVIVKMKECVILNLRLKSLLVRRSLAMKRKIFSILLSLALVVSMIPAFGVTASAETVNYGAFVSNLDMGTTRPGYDVITKNLVFENTGNASLKATSDYIKLEFFSGDVDAFTIIPRTGYSNLEPRQKGGWMFQISTVKGLPPGNYSAKGAIYYDRDGSGWEYRPEQIGNYFNVSFTVSDTAPLYKINVINGTADKSSAADGHIVNFTANDAPSGYEFNRWVLESGTIGGAFGYYHVNKTMKLQMNASDVKLKAYYKPAGTWAVSFDANGGTGTQNEMYITKGNALTLPQCTFTPPENKVFDKWDVGPAGSTGSISKDMEVKAIWKSIPTIPIPGPVSVNFEEPVEGQQPDFNASLVGGYSSYCDLATDTPNGKTLVYMIDANRLMNASDTFSSDHMYRAMVWVEGKNLGDGQVVFNKDTEFLINGKEAVVDWNPKNEYCSAIRLYYDYSPVTQKPNPFVDVRESDPYYDAVLWAYYHEPFITNGIDATHFGPMNTVKRCESVTFLWRAMGSPKPSSYYNPFKDVKSSDYYYEPVLWAVEKGITNGTTATTFAPNDTLTTAHMITFLYRTKTGNVGQSGEKWYEDAANWAGNGYGGKPFGVDVVVNNWTPCPRANVVMFLQKAL